jgi:hypothetical protein
LDGSHGGGVRRERIEGHVIAESFKTMYQTAGDRLTVAYIKVGVAQIDEIYPKPVDRGVRKERGVPSWLSKTSDG